MHRGGAAAGTWKSRGDGVAADARGRDDVDISRRRVAATLWPRRRGYFVEASRGDAVAAKSPSVETGAFLRYTKHLGPHHNVVMRNIALLLMQVIPDRARMMELFQKEDFSDVQPHTRAWIDTALPLCAKIDEFFRAHNVPGCEC